MAKFIAALTNRSASQKVHIIINCSGVQQLDYANQDVRDAFNELATHEWLGTVIAIVSNYSIQAHWNATNRAFGSRWKNVISLEAAIQMLKKFDTLILSVPKPVMTSPIIRPDKSMIMKQDKRSISAFIMPKSRPLWYSWTEIYLHIEWKLRK